MQRNEHLDGARVGGRGGGGIRDQRVGGASADGADLDGIGCENLVPALGVLPLNEVTREDLQDDASCTH